MWHQSRQCNAKTERRSDSTVLDVPKLGKSFAPPSGMICVTWRMSWDTPARLNQHCGDVKTWQVYKKRVISHDKCHLSKIGPSLLPSSPETLLSSPWFLVLPAPFFSSPCWLWDRSVLLILAQIPTSHRSELRSQSAQKTSQVDVLISRFSLVSIEWLPRSAFVRYQKCYTELY
jgi:hypothetical protein